MNERKTYYVAVGAGQVLEDREAAAFEFEIRANEEELDRLQRLFAATSDADESAAFRFIERFSASEEESNADYAKHLKAIYRMLHRLGTEETKYHIESMNVLD